MIVKMLKTEDIPDKITLASSQTSSDFNSSVSISIPYKSVVTGDELILPGLGVLIELFWNDLSSDEKKNIASLIKKNLN